MTEFKGDTSGSIKQFYALLEHINQAIGDILTPYIYGQAWQRCPQRHWQRESRGKWQMERDAS